MNEELYADSELKQREEVVHTLALQYKQLMEYGPGSSEHGSKLLPVAIGENDYALSMVKPAQSDMGTFAVFIYQGAMPHLLGNTQAFEKILVTNEPWDCNLVDLVLVDRAKLDTLHILCDMIEVALEAQKENHETDILCYR